MDLRLKIAAAARMMAKAGCDPNDLTAQVSARTEDGDDAFWITPLEYCELVRPEDLIKVGFDRRQRAGGSEQSRVVNFYAAIYRRRPDVGAVIHTHAYHASLLAALGEVADLYNNRSIMFFEDQAVYGDELTLPPSDGTDAAEALGDMSVLIAKNHGIFVAAESVETTTILAISFATAARFHIEAKMLGATPSFVASGDADTAEAQRKALIERRDYQRSYLGTLWDANLRRLEHEDPYFATG
jgi:ribulose-5-phosphate 4-epimerase/fuculose-1-phosphate aldolase